MSEQAIKKPNILGMESIPRLMLRYAIPSVVSMVVAAVYNVADQVFIGRGVGFLGNAATTVAFPLVTVGLGLSLLTGVGAAASISLDLGRAETKHAKKTLGNAMFMVLALSVLVSVTSLAFIRPVLALLGATEPVMPFALEYTGTLMLGMPFMMGTIAASHVIRADGSPRYSMLCTLTGAVINIILDPIFIFALRKGVGGVALATVISQGVSFFLALYYLLYRAKYVRISISDIKPDIEIIKRISGLGSSSLVNQLSMVAVTIILNRSLIYYGAKSPYGSEIPLAALGIVMKINMILISVILGISIGLQPIIGYNYGAKNYGRVKRAFLTGVIATSSISLGVNALFLTVPQVFISIFGDADPAFNEFARLSLRTFMALVFAAGIQIPSSQFFMAIGKPLKAMLLTSSRSVFALIPLMLILPLFFGLNGVLYASPASDVSALLVTSYFVTRELKSLPETKTS